LSVAADHEGPTFRPLSVVAVRFAVGAGASVSGAGCVVAFAGLDAALVFPAAS